MICNLQTTRLGPSPSARRAPPPSDGQGYRISSFPPRLRGRWPRLPRTEGVRIAKRSNSSTPSVADYRATSPEDGGGKAICDALSRRGGRGSLCVPGHYRGTLAIESWNVPLFE